jgi:phosphoglycolate phosphatase-like HAD superfamily hydrolase
MLILFDIDGTILRSQGAGLNAMEQAARELFGEHFSFEGVEVAGRLDTLIWSDAARRNSLEDAAAHHDRFRRRYAELLRDRLANGASLTIMPGVRELIAALRRLPHITLGLLTGNYPETGRLKIEAAGFTFEHFEVNAWGCDGSHRRDLPPLAIRDYRQLKGRTIEPADVTIIGDTPHDIDCAHAHGCRCLAVATGDFSAAALEESGADRVVRDLSQTDDVCQWLLRSAAHSRH